MCSATPRGWAGWARAAAARPLLLRGCVGVPESDGVLRRLCEAREVGGIVSAQTGSCDAPADSRHAAHHRPSESVAVGWLTRQVERVRASAVLRAILRLPGVGAAATATAAAPAEACVGAAMAVALGVVAEYVPVRLRATLAVACGLADPAAAPACSPTAAGAASHILLSLCEVHDNGMRMLVGLRMGARLSPTRGLDLSVLSALLPTAPTRVCARSGAAAAGAVVCVLGPRHAHAR
ncbi:hypothetical_protein_-_conserved [Leishmania infantum]|uniref:Hypothetical_protein_-_conserved n=1 Tax=Leishmania infantum TaxID=5671 RepID=A0A6L0WKU8_LEIIN|nr:hypothetical_protein_-_conserved [Leishmania infantum]SUZ40018.1 hypothetical_protein_-_conserved [Leishmania infantum]